MDQSTFNLFIGVGMLVSILVCLVVVILQHKQIGALVQVLQTANQNPAILQAIKGATEGIPQDAFVKLLSVLTTARMFAPEDFKALIDQFVNLTKSVDKDPSNDPSATPQEIGSHG